jgi:hypothetical protein
MFYIFFADGGKITSRVGVERIGKSAFDRQNVHTVDHVVQSGRRLDGKIFLKFLYCKFYKRVFSARYYKFIIFSLLLSL